MHYYVHILHISISLHPPSFDVNPPFYMSTANSRTHFELATYDCMWFVSDCLMDALHLVVIQFVIMDLVIYDAHIIHYHRDLLWLMALG